MLPVFAAAVAAEPDSDRLWADLEALTGIAPIDTPDGPTAVVSRSIHHPHVALVETWLEERFQELGLEVGTQTFEASGVTCTNVWGDLPGSDASLVIVGAHFDSTAKAVEGWDAETDPAPGADDDASGTAAVLEMARLFAAEEATFRHTLRFVAFSAEEVGLVGSANMAASLASEGAEVRLMISIDPIGYDAGDADRLFVVYDPQWTEEALWLDDAEGPQDVFALDRDLIGGGARSDHASFWTMGFPAIHVATFPQPPQYHTPDDTLEVVDLESVHDSTDLVYRLVRDVAEPLPPPEAEPEPKGCTCTTASAPLGFFALLGPLCLCAIRVRSSPLPRTGRGRP